MEISMPNTQNLIKNLLQKYSLLTDAAPCSCLPFSGDGSDRKFFRFQGTGKKSFVIIFPSSTNPAALAEAKASFLIGRHLYDHGLPVPKPYAFDNQLGVVIFEDLGNELLYDAAVDSPDINQTRALYRQAVECLAAFQIKGREGFNTNFCWDTRRYDRQLMLERESHYFSREFCRKYLGFSIPVPLEQEFIKLTARISREPNDYLLHRDFQSRNLMLVKGSLKIIDFQGARLGPLGYDLASLLNDPYARLTENFKQELTEHYLHAVGSYQPISVDEFLQGYGHISLQRNLQVLGAYAYLTNEKNKKFFRPFIKPALDTLINLLEGPLSANYPILHELSNKAAEKIREISRESAGISDR